jgi:ABC-2 type transport system ATP-binding protein
MIEVRGLVKRYGDKVAVNDLSFDVEPGHVTGFLGPNGAGKTTTMRLILGLDYPEAGSVAIDGQQYASLANPMHEVGALLDAKAVHGGRSAYNHLLCLAQTNNLPKRRVGEVLELVGLTDVARKRTKGFSLGMAQRLGIAATMLGDPAVLMFDEPVNGLDPEGILWIRNLMKALAAEGRTVFVSSHLMSEMENTADHLIVIGRGRLLADCTMDEFIARSSGQTVRVRTPQPDVLAQAVSEARAGAGAVARAGAGADGAGASTATVTTAADGSLTVHGLTAAQIGDIAFEHGVRLHELTVVRASLEAAFMELTADSVEYRAGQGSADQDGRGAASGADGHPAIDGRPSPGVPAGTRSQPSAEGQYSVEGRI